MKALLRNPTTLAGVILCLVIVVGAVLAPWIAPHDPIEQSILERLQPPGGDFLLGTDVFGRDVLSRILWGARISLVVAVVSIALAIVVGGAIGMVSGYVGGRVDMFIMQVMDVLLSFPSLILGLIVVALLGAEMRNLIFAISLRRAQFRAIFDLFQVTAPIAQAPILTMATNFFARGTH